MLWLNKTFFKDILNRVANICDDVLNFKIGKGQIREGEKIVVDYKDVLNIGHRVIGKIVFDKGFNDKERHISYIDWYLEK